MEPGTTGGPSEVNVNDAVALLYCVGDAGSCPLPPEHTLTTWAGTVIGMHGSATRGDGGIHGVLPIIRIPVCHRHLHDLLAVTLRTRAHPAERGEPGAQRDPNGGPMMDALTKAAAHSQDCAKRSMSHHGLPRHLTACRCQCHKAPGEVVR